MLGDPMEKKNKKGKETRKRKGPADIKDNSIE
jgi:hypothetical protein